LFTLKLEKQLFIDY